jgi:tetratricopeptide (TPR) repeat protein
MRSLVAIVLAGCLSAAAGAQPIASDRDRRDAVAFLRAGLEAMSAERFDRAVQEFSNAIKKDPLLTVAHYDLGRSYMELRDFPHAIEAYSGCVEAERSLFDIGQRNVFELERRRDDQIRELKQAIDQRAHAGAGPLVLVMEQQLQNLQDQKRVPADAFHPSAEVLLALGSAYFRAGNRDLAETEWRAAVAVNSGLGEAHNNLAVIDMQKSQFDDAERELDLAEKAGFSVNPQFRTDLKRMKNGAP